MSDFQELLPESKNWVAAEALRTIRALREDPPHSVWLEKHLDNLLWFWSVDRMKSERVVRDAIPQGAGDGGVFAWHRSTRRAREAHHGVRSKSIRRDHAVPKKVLRDLLRQADTAARVEQLLDLFNVVVFIHIDEDTRLTEAKLREKMPAGWDAHPVLERDPWARYRAVGLDVDVTPAVPPLRPVGRRIRVGRQP